MKNKKQMSVQDEQAVGGMKFILALFSFIPGLIFVLIGTDCTTEFFQTFWAVIGILYWAFIACPLSWTLISDTSKHWSRDIRE